VGVVFRLDEGNASPSRNKNELGYNSNEQTKEVK